jgi:hypothetical protein
MKYFLALLLVSVAAVATTTCKLKQTLTATACKEHAVSKEFNFVKYDVFS